MFQSLGSAFALLAIVCTFAHTPARTWALIGASPQGQAAAPLR